MLDLCRKLGAKTVTKGKSMIGEEIAINEYLEANGITPVETDLGEYIIQLRHELPSHIIAPAVHLTKAQVEADFRRVHTHLPADRNLDEPTTMLAEARGMLREKFLAADVGITGANFLVAETGSSIIVTNEGNGDLTQTLPKAHIVLASIEKLVPTLEDAAQMLRVLARSATGQEMSVYTTISTGPRRAGDPDGPGEYHVVILDNGRSAMLGGQFRDMLRCIRCGACMNHCPVYHAVGGHAYGWVYPGPMGAVLTPSLIGLDKAGTSAERIDILRALRGSLPGAHSAAEADAALARARVRTPSVAGDGARRLEILGLVRDAAAALRARDVDRDARAVIGRPSARAILAGCRSPAAGRSIANFRAPQGATFQSQWKERQPMSARDVIFASIRSSLARQRPGSAAPQGSRGSAERSSGRRRAGARPSCRRKSGSRCSSKC